MNLKYPDYTNSILNVTNSILKHYNVDVSYPTIPELDKELEKGYNHIIYILLDGMGTNIIKEHLSPNDALRKYLRQEITSVFPPTTVAATNAVLSGLPPYVNGYVGWTQYFKKEDTDLIVFFNSDYYSGVAQNEILRDKYLSFKSIYEQINDAQPTIITNEFFPSFRENGSDTFLEEIDKALLVTHNTDQSFSYLYWTEPDLTEHVKGIHSNEVKELMIKLNNDFQSLLDNITEDTLVICIADHGLTDINEIHLNEYESVTSLLKRKPSIEPRATSFFVEKENHDAFRKEFNNHFSNHFKLYNRDEFYQTGLLGYGNKHPMLDDFIGDFFAISQDDSMFVFHTSKNYISHHAGLTEDEMMVPLILHSKKALK